MQNNISTSEWYSMVVIKCDVYYIFNVSIKLMYTQLIQ